MDIERIISGLIGGAVSGGIALGAAADFIFDTIVTMKEIFRKRKEQQNINKQEEINVKTPS